MNKTKKYSQKLSFALCMTLWNERIRGIQDTDNLKLYVHKMSPSNTWQRSLNTIKWTLKNLSMHWAYITKKFNRNRCCTQEFCYENVNSNIILTKMKGCVDNIAVCMWGHIILVWIKNSTDILINIRQPFKCLHLP